MPNGPQVETGKVNMYLHITGGLSYRSANCRGTLQKEKEMAVTARCDYKVLNAQLSCTPVHHPAGCLQH